MSALFSLKFSIHINNFLAPQQSMLLSLFLVTFRIRGTVAYDYDYVAINDFGFEKGGNFTYSFNLNVSGSSLQKARINVLLLNNNQFKTFLIDDYMGNINYSLCDYDNAGAVIQSQINLVKGQYQIFSGEIVRRDVYYTVLMNCDADNAEDDDKYYVSATFMNPNNQHLDYRDIPSLTTLPVMIGMSSVILVAFIAYLLYHKRHFLKIYIFLIIINSLYITYLVFSLIALEYERTHDEFSIWKICLRVFIFLYCSTLFSTLSVASTGWCILNVKMKAKNILISVFAVIVFFAATFVQMYMNLGYWEIILLVVQVVTTLVIARILYSNTSRAQKHIKAHLYVIQGQGIDAVSTPIYEKLSMYTYFLYVSALSLLIYLIMILVLAIVFADAWVIELMNNLSQMGIIVAIMIVYRPRGKAVDRYLESDDFEEGDRSEVNLEDLDGFKFGEGGKRWDEGMKLPLEPIIIGEDTDMNKPILSKQKTNYTSIEEPLNRGNQEDV